MTWQPDNTPLPLLDVSALIRPHEESGGHDIIQCALLLAMRSGKINENLSLIGASSPLCDQYCRYLYRIAGVMIIADTLHKIDVELASDDPIADSYQTLVQRLSEGVPLSKLPAAALAAEQSSTNLKGMEVIEMLKHHPNEVLGECVTKLSKLYGCLGQDGAAVNRLVSNDLAALEIAVAECTKGMRAEKKYHRNTGRGADGENQGGSRGY